MALKPEVAIAGIVVFAGASFFFALAESALFSLSKWRAKQLAERSPVQGQRVTALLADPQSLLATTVLGNTLANACLIVTALWLGLEGQWPTLWTLAGTLALVLIGCEVIPKTIAVRNAEAWSLRVVAPLYVFLRCTEWPRRLSDRLNNAILRIIVPRTWQPQVGLTDDEYHDLFELAYLQGALARSEKEIIIQIIQLDRRTVKDAMKPRPQMACIPDDLPVEEMVAAARRYKHRRLPLYDETPDTIVGILNTRTLLLDPDAGLEEAVEFPSFVPETMNLLQLFRSFQRQQRGMAIVLDEFGGTAGLVTMEDILEEIIGELKTEGKAEEVTIEKIGPDEWRVGGTVRLDDFRRELPELEDFPGVETIGGLLVQKLEVVPAPGEFAIVGSLKLTALMADERRVRELKVEIVRKRRSATLKSGTQ